MPLRLYLPVRSPETQFQTIPFLLKFLNISSSYRGGNQSISNTAKTKTNLINYLQQRQIISFFISRLDHRFRFDEVSDCALTRKHFLLLLFFFLLLEATYHKSYCKRLIHRCKCAIYSALICCTIEQFTDKIYAFIFICSKQLAFYIAQYNYSQYSTY